MRWISSDPLNRFRFPIDDWRFVEVEPSLDDLGVTETLFSIGNGYLGMRGNPEEGRKSYSHGTFINGFHETWTIKHAEEAFGFASTGQTIVNVPDAKLIKIYVDDEPLTLGQSDLDHYERALDFRAGCLTRDLVWRTPAGKRVKLSSRRMVSFTDRHLALFEIELTMMEGDAPIVLSSQVVNRQDGFDDYRQPKNEEGFDPRRAGKFDGRVLQPRGQWHDDQRMALGYESTDSHMTLRPRAPTRWSPASRRIRPSRSTASRHARECRSSSARRSPTTPREECPSRSCTTAAAAPSIAWGSGVSIRSSRDSAPGSTTSGPTRTLRWVDNPAFNRPSAGVYSSWPRQRLARIS